MCTSISCLGHRLAVLPMGLVVWAAIVQVGCARTVRREAVGRFEHDEQVLLAWLLQVARVPPAALDQPAGAQLLRLAQRVGCPCRDTRETLAECAERSSCVRVPYALRQVVRGAARGEADDMIVSELLERFGPRERERIDVTEAPCRGRGRRGCDGCDFFGF